MQTPIKRLLLHDKTIFSARCKHKYETAVPRRYCPIFQKIQKTDFLRLTFTAFVNRRKRDLRRLRKYRAIRTCGIFLRPKIKQKKPRSTGLPLYFPPQNKNKIKNLPNSFGYICCSLHNRHCRTILCILLWLFCSSVPRLFLPHT